MLWFPLSAIWTVTVLCFIGHVSGFQFVSLPVRTTWSNPSDGGDKFITLFSGQRAEDSVADFVLMFRDEIPPHQLERVEREYLHLLCTTINERMYSDANMKQCDGKPPNKFVMELEWPEMTPYFGDDFNTILIVRAGYSVNYYVEVMCARKPDMCNNGFVSYFIRDKLTKTISNIPKLKSCGFEPAHILDIGANVGEWAAKTQKIFPRAGIFMIEGNAYCSDKLTATGIPFEISLVGNYEGSSTYYIDSHDLTSTGNSIFKENSDLFSDALEVTVPISTIDNIVARRGLPPFQYMKMDIQGAELIALEGARKTLQSIEVIITEAALMEYNNFGNSFLEMYVLLDKLGYGLFDIVDVIRDHQHNVAFQFDVLWVRMDSPLWRADCTGYPTPRYFRSVLPEAVGAETDSSADDSSTGSVRTEPGRVLTSQELAARAFYELKQRVGALAP
jgi:FkbM family methyltransferase